jgi:DNA modification methylase
MARCAPSPRQKAWCGSKDQDADTVHGTQKPVECMRRSIINNSIPGDAIYEPFLGSGTTLIAAETTGRVCFAIELDPLYADVAVRRWQAFTGQGATRAADSASFDAIAASLKTDASAESRAVAGRVQA